MSLTMNDATLGPEDYAPDYDGHDRRMVRLDDMFEELETMHSDCEQTLDLIERIRRETVAQLED